MKVELSEQDVINTVEFLSRTPLKGAESFVMAMLIQTFRVTMQPKEAPPAREDDKPAKNGATPKATAKEKSK